MPTSAKTLFAASSVLGALALSVGVNTSSHAGPVAQPPASEKCFGVAKAGRNDCAAGAHSCAGQATRNGDRAAYVYLPRGACAKLAGGSLTPGA